MKKTIIGLDLDKEFSQISYYSERTGEPETVSIAQNQDRYLIPTPQGLFSGKEAEKDLAVFIERCISFLNPAPQMQDLYMMITMREVRQPWIDRIRSACESIGMFREHVFL